jgi:hypothetical protein
MRSLIDGQPMPARQGDGLRFIRVPIDRCRETQKCAQERRSISSGQPATPFVDHQRVADFELPDAWSQRLIGSNACQSCGCVRVVFVGERSRQCDERVQHEWLQHLCPSCRADSNSSSVSLPTRARKGPIAWSISAWRH